MNIRSLFLILPLCTLLACAAPARTAWAAPACPDEVAWEDPDGTGATEQVRLYGDEDFSFTADEEGRLIVLDANGDAVYVREDAGGAYRLGAPVFGDAAAGANSLDVKDEDVDRAKLDALTEDITGNVDQASNAPIIGTIPNDPLYGCISSRKNVTVTEPARGAATPLMVLRIWFDDARPAFTDAQWNARFFGASGSVAAYYRDVSGGGFTYAPVSETSGTPNDGVITVRLAMKAPPFVTKGSKREITCGLYGTAGKPYYINNKSALFAYAVKAAEPYVNWTRYDRNGDGYLSPSELAFAVILPGTDASACGGKLTDRPGIWPHHWTVNDRGLRSVRVSNKWVYAYSMIAENTDMGYRYSAAGGAGGKQTQIGTICHELGHDLGLPDLYNTNGNVKTADNVGGLSLMSNGCWGARSGQPSGSSPVHLDAWSKLMLGFCSSQSMPANRFAASYSLGASKPYSVRMIETEDPQVYFLLENRQFWGGDAGLAKFYRSGGGLKAGGLVVWRIDWRYVEPWFSAGKNTVNTRDGQYGIMPLFWAEKTVCNEMRVPFWSGGYTDLRPALILPDMNPPRPNALQFHRTAGAAVYAKLVIAEEEGDEIDGMNAAPEGVGEYGLVPGGPSRYVWTRGSGKPLTFRVDGPFADFADAWGDGYALAQGRDCTAAEGSTVITLLPAYLETLTVGDHTLHVTFDRNSLKSYATAVFYVEEPESAPPRTGVGAAPLPWLVGLTLSAWGLAVLTARKRRMGKRSRGSTDSTGGPWG